MNTSVYQVLAILCVITNAQRTDKETCECQPMRDGRCAYTLVLPAPGGGPNRGPNGGSCDLPTDSTREPSTESPTTAAPETTTRDRGRPQRNMTRPDLPEFPDFPDWPYDFDPEIELNVNNLRAEVVDLSSRLVIQQTSLTQLQGAMIELQASSIRLMSCNICSGTVDVNVTIDHNITIPDMNITMPDVNITMPDVNITMPDVNITIPEVNITMPDINITVPDVNITIPDMDFNFTMPNISIPTAGCCCPECLLLSGNFGLMTSDIIRVTTNVLELATTVQEIQDRVDEALPIISTLPETQDSLNSTIEAMDALEQEVRELRRFKEDMLNPHRLGYYCVFRAAIVRFVDNSDSGILRGFTPLTVFGSSGMENIDREDDSEDDEEDDDGGIFPGVPPGFPVADDVPGGIPDPSNPFNQGERIKYSNITWCSKDRTDDEPNADEEYVQYDLGLPTVIQGVVTLGRKDYNQWVTKLRIDYTLEPRAEGLPNTWTHYLGPTGEPEVFVANDDRNTVKTNMFWQPILATQVRIIPIESYKDRNKCLRADLIGCLDGLQV